jgi:hypothetical protein
MQLALVLQGHRTVLVDLVVTHAQLFGSELVDLARVEDLQFLRKPEAS